MLSRTRSHVLLAPFRVHNYRTLRRSLRAYTNPISTLYRYVSNRGDYPVEIGVRTPVGPVRVTAPTFHDLRTINEVFCRGDYAVGPDVRVVVDVGANIGISALFFLTRNESSRVYCFEPSPINAPRLRAALAPFGDRAAISETALSDRDGVFEFNAEPVGRYSGLVAPGYARDLVNVVQVQTVNISDALDEILQVESFIDVLKIDTEGSEEAILRSIRPDLLPKIGEMFVEVNLDEPLFPDHFTQVSRPDGIAHFRAREH
ncbi:FkbM family methyltransferase [Aeromicrobium duanguangcaii]|uniref:FkbM family methyltransferase n=1 Tax=Aeromicrobium duanguangcaii TaxID=2968086 RepID=A0ABY5KF58_9ACTN|nr:FkbM family methyltransferase [Aeromicrobium duanguangcaii]MCD9154526.1 FkbM family methyltransferase [Aeromicrobium duanguangcaii]UUI68418.1 FkbM family methyltransferase [Aeromicrobium duanguangcaii]